MKRTVIALSLGLLLAPLVGQAQVVVEDPGQIAQGVVQAANMVQQLTQLQNQLTQMENTYKSLSGSSGFGQLLNGSNSVIQQGLPSDVSKVYNDAMGSSSVNTGAATAMSNSFDSQINNMSRGDALTYINTQLRQKGAYDRVATQNAYNNQMRELTDMQSMTQQIDSTTSQKEISDLQARIQTSQGTIQGEQAKLQLMSMLQGSQDKILEQQKELAVRRYSIGTADDDNTAPDVTE
jgi:type IV secretion system protein VirB5